MLSSKCRVYESRMSGSNWNSLLEIEKRDLETHIESCEECRSFMMVSEQLNSVGEKINPSQIPPLIERRTVLAALEGRLPKAQRVRYVPKLSFVGATAVLFGAVVFGLYFGVFSANQNDDTVKIDSTVVVDRSAKQGEHIESKAIRSVVASHSVHFDKSGEPLELQAGTRVWGSVTAALSVEELSPSSTRLRLFEGRIVADVKSAGKNKRFVVAIPSGEIEVRGTMFSVEVIPNGTEIVRVLEGIVEITDFSRD